MNRRKLLLLGVPAALILLVLILVLALRGPSGPVVVCLDPGHEQAPAPGDADGRDRDVAQPRHHRRIDQVRAGGQHVLQGNGDGERQHLLVEALVCLHTISFSPTRTVYPKRRGIARRTALTNAARALMMMLMCYQYNREKEYRMVPADSAWREAFAGLEASLRETGK